MVDTVSAVRAGLVLAAWLPALTSGDDVLDFGDEYYLGFSQGAYYGLMLGGIGYDVAWCMKTELEYEARSLGAGGEFQRKLEELLATCSAENPVADDN